MFFEVQTRNVGVQVCLHKKWETVKMKWYLPSFVSYPIWSITWHTLQNSFWLLTPGLFFSSTKIFVCFDSWMLELGGCTKYLRFLIFFLLPRWNNTVAKYLISVMLGYFHLDAEHFSWNDFKICRINAICVCVTVSLLFKVRMRIVSSVKRLRADDRS